MSSQKILYMLIGPKGSGKTHIGTLVNQHTDIVFVRVERIWLGLKPGEDGWKKVEAVIDSMFQTHNKVMIESLGVGEEFSEFYAALAEKYFIKMIRVYAELKTCFTRVKSRNNVEHIDVSDDKVIEFNRIAATVTFEIGISKLTTTTQPQPKILSVQFNPSMMLKVNNKLSLKPLVAAQHRRTRRLGVGAFFSELE